MNLTDKSISCIVKINLTDMEAEMRSAKVQALLDSGFQIKCCFPASDDGIPIALLIFERIKKEEKLHGLTIINIIIYTLCIVILTFNIYEILN